MNKKITAAIVTFCFLLSLSPLKSQVKYWVYFKNKNGTPYTLLNANDFLSPKSVNRRTLYNTAVDPTDLPVTPSYVSQVAAVSNVTVIYASKWLNGVVVSIPNANLNTAINAINALPFVQTLGQVNRYALNLPKPQTAPVGDEAAQQGMKASNTNSFNMGGSYWQNKQLNVDCLHDMGKRGQGMTIAVMDIGFTNVNNNPLFDSLRNRGGIKGTRNFVNGGTNVYGPGMDHGAYVLSCMAAVKPGLIMGSAPMADYWLLRTEDGGTETLTEEYNWIRAAEFADSVGVDILTTSLGYTTFDNSAQNHNYNMLDGRTAPMSIAATMAARKGMFVLNAAGNEGNTGWQYIGVPADADSICTVGSIDSLSNYSVFSSVGPTKDGRIKPDLVARGSGSWVSSIDGAYCFPGNGTSFATPILAGAVACFWQAHRGINNIQVLKTLKNSASNKDAPNNQIGWGKPDVCQFVLGIGDRGRALLQAEVTVAPNPFNGSINIDLGKVNSGPVTIEVSDVLGNIIASTSTDLKNHVIDSQTYNNGIYFLTIRTTEGSLTKKIIRQ